jgi:hypothetical protein
LLEVLSELH